MLDNERWIFPIEFLKPLLVENGDTVSIFENSQSWNAAV